jgi:hypothetical protein
VITTGVVRGSNLRETRHVGSPHRDYCSLLRYRDSQRNQQYLIITAQIFCAIFKLQEDAEKGSTIGKARPIGYTPYVNNI